MKQESDQGGHPDKPRVLRLRYPGACDVCGTALPAGTQALYDPARRRVRCLTCSTSATVVGVAGLSAAREHQRRIGRHQQKVASRIADDSAWRAQLKSDHPVVGRIVTAFKAKRTVGPEPQHITAWKIGADGEQRVGEQLNRWATATECKVLHDRRIPRSRANIDHLAINAAGVWVIDTKNYRGQITTSRRGMFSQPELRVGGRDRTDLADEVHQQMEVVAAALDDAALDDAALGGDPRPPVQGVLCFVGADWPLIGGTFTIKGITVAWPAAVIKLLTRSGQGSATDGSNRWAAVLAERFPAA